MFAYRIDKHNRIIYTNQEWSQFAVDNGAESLTDENVLGSNLFTYIDNVDVQLLWSHLLDRARLLGKVMSFSFRCDSPRIRRYMLMELHLCENNEIEFQNMIEKIEEREPITTSRCGDSVVTGFQIICSWCKKIHVGNSNWEEIDAAIRSLDLFGHAHHIHIKNSMCPCCYERIIKTA